MTRKLMLVAALVLAIGGVTAVIAIAAGGDATTPSERVDAGLDELRAAADDEDLAAATRAAGGLRGSLAGLRPVR